MSTLNKKISSVSGNKKKCREVWPTAPMEYEKVFAIFLDMILLVLPLIVLGAAYFLISQTLWQSMDTEKQLVKQTSGTICLCPVLVSLSVT